MDNTDISFALAVPAAAILGLTTESSDILHFRYTFSTLTGAVIDSGITDVIAKLSVPGGLVSGEIPVDPDHPYRNTQLGQAIVAPPQITTLTPAVTVTIPDWSFRESDDVITLNFGGLTFERTAGDGTVVIALSHDEMMAAASSAQAPVSWCVRDRVGNWSRWSPPAFVSILTLADPLPAPLLLQASSGTLDPADLDNGIQVLLNAPVNPGDEVVVYWDGQTAAAPVSAGHAIIPLP